MDYTRSSDPNAINERYMDSIVIEERLIGSVAADTTAELFGSTFSMPVMTPAFSHIGKLHGREMTGLEEYSAAAGKLNILNFCGMMENDMFERIVSRGAKTVRIVKPYADNAKVRDQMRFAEDAGAFGIGMDIDHIFGEKGYDICVGELMASQTEDMLASYVSDTKLPFFVKGVLSVSDALKCADIGVRCIIVSHHHGRMPYAMPPTMILPEIKKALSGRDVKILVDCGIASGADVYKAIALGADGACVGRSMMAPLESSGIQGVRDFITGVGNELRLIMSFTGARTVKDIDSSTLHFMK
ncbi:MAG: alpha-hydroxy-acid oxidizing protein [Oscillospiraceae bacterium]|nr:alpha-hydroxy-acid oxidizing protein [Oscillospiraceae bacterium]